MHEVAKDLFSSHLLRYFVNCTMHEKAGSCRSLFPQCFPARNTPMKLDAKAILCLQLSRGKTDQIFFDEALAGFGYRLRDSGGRVRRSWVAQYRAGGRTRRVSIGPAEILSPSEARTAARKILAKVSLGEDPQGDKAAKRQQDIRTLRSVVSAYLSAKEPELRPSSFRVTRLYLTGPYFKPLHYTSINSITHPDVAARISAIKRINGAVTAGRARAAVSALFKWSIAEGLMGRAPVNPVVGTHKPADPREEDLAVAKRAE